MGSGETPILRDCDAGEVARLRARGQFFWTDLAVADGPPPEEVASAFELSGEATAALFDFTRGGSPAQRIHVERALIVFPFWCAAHPDAAPQGGADALEIFRVNVLLHGDFLLTVHQRRFDLPGETTEGRIPPGRSERYAVYVALDGMTNTLLEALATIEREIGDLESRLLDSGTRTNAPDQRLIRSLRSRLTTMRMRSGAERALFGRVGEEIEQIPSLEPDREAYFERIQSQLDLAVDRIDAASSALSHALDIQLNETTFKLTVIATIFLPLTFLTGFFGMNFGWMVDQIGSPAAFWLLGVGLMTGPLILVLALLRGGDAAEHLRSLGRRLAGR
jgi:magnesium transporter